MRKVKDRTPPSEQIPLVVVDDVPTMDVDPPVVSFPPVLDLEHVWGSTVMAGADLWKLVVLNHGGHPKHVNIPAWLGGLSCFQTR